MYGLVPPPTHKHIVLQHLRDFTLLKLKTNLASLLKQCEATEPGINRTGKSFHINHLCLFFLYFGPKNIWPTHSELFDTVSKINAQLRYMEKISPMTENVCVSVCSWNHFKLVYTTICSLSQATVSLSKTPSACVWERRSVSPVDLKTHNNALFKINIQKVIWH